MPGFSTNSRCVGAVTFGSWLGRQDVDDMSSVVEFPSTPYTQRYGGSGVHRINVSAPGQITSISTANGSAVAAEVSE